MAHRPISLAVPYYELRTKIPNYMPENGTATETRLAYRVRRLSTAEREELMARTGLSRTTLYARLNDPGKLTLDEAAAINLYLEELDNEDYDLNVLLLPVDIGTR